MKHYPHHIGDFDKATRHLSRIERSIYRDLIDLYYDTEQPLTLDLPALCRRIVARSNEESTAVEQVLNEFFTKTGNGWFHARCDEEIEAYRANNSQKAQAGKASAEAKRLRKLQALNGNSTPVERPLKSVATADNGASTNHQPINQSTNNQEGEPRRRSSSRPEAVKPDDVTFETWNDWLALRKAKKAPVTATVVKQATAEAAKAGMTLEAFLRVWCARGSQGLEASWLRTEDRAPPAETAYQRSMRERVGEIAPGLARPAPGAAKNPTEFFETALPPLLETTP